MPWSFGPSGRERHPALLRRAVKDREIELRVIGIERGEEVEHLVHHLARARLLLVDLVHRDDRLQADLQRLRDHEFRLRHRAFGGIDEHDRAIDHAEDALDLAAEIGMARRVDDIDARAFPHHGGAFGQNGDAALAFELVQIHHALGDALILPEGAGLAEQLVDERRLAMIDMSDDGDVAHVHGRT